MKVLECEGCGGTLAYHPDREQTQCLFCGGVSLRLSDAVVSEAAPTEAVAWTVQPQEAEALFRTWARSSWWHPPALRRLGVSLEKLWIPAWRVEAEIDLHWAGLRRAKTASGVEPIAGRARSRRCVWIPASQGLRQRELEALAPFPADACIAWSREDPVAHEVLGRSAAAATQDARAMLLRDARAAVARSEGIRRVRGTAVLDAVDARSLMLPIYIGCVRFRDRPWRFVVNGQTGRIVGEAPLDRRKVAFAALVVVLAVVVALRVSHLF